MLLGVRQRQGCKAAITLQRFKSLVADLGVARGAIALPPWNLKENKHKNVLKH